MPLQNYFEEYTFMHQIEKAVISSERPTIPNETPNNFAKLIQDCWSDAPEHRPSFSNVVLRLEQAHIT